jgi:hypothetical protein
MAARRPEPRSSASTRSPSAQRRRQTLAEEIAQRKPAASCVPPAERRRRDASFLRLAVLGQPTATCRDGVPMTAEQREQFVADFERTRPERIRRVFAAQRLHGTPLPVAPVRRVPRRTCEGRRRPGARRVASRSAGGGSSGDSDEGEPAEGRHQDDLLRVGAR